MNLPLTSILIPFMGGTAPFRDLRVILRGVSRSFYLTLQVAPRKLRAQLGLAYLFCRAADTIADTALLPPSRRRALLDVYRSQFLQEAPDLGAAGAIARELTPAQSIPEERILLESLERCFGAYLLLSGGDRALIRRLVATLTLGMEMDLETFPLASARAGEGEVPGASEGPDLEALPDDAALDRYCYHVAGCVGEFWTDLAAAHLPALSGWDLPRMREKGILFGKGLQMTNVIRDIPQDLRKGRSYIPWSRLEAAGIPLEALRGGGSPERPLPAELGTVIDDLLDLTLSRYQEGWSYTLSIPGLAPRLRLACAWPLLIGLETIALVRGRKEDLLRGAHLMIPQKNVWRIRRESSIRVFSAKALDGLYRRREKGALKK